MTVIDDTAVLKAEDRFLRPSDLYEAEGPIPLMFCNRTGDPIYVPCIAIPKQSTYARIRYSHGPTLNVGYTDKMIGTINTGFEGAKPRNTYDSVKKIRKNFKYIKIVPRDLHLMGKDSLILNLSDFTDKKSGTFDFGSEDIYRFLGMYLKNGFCNKDKYVRVNTSRCYKDYWEYIISNIPLELTEVRDSKNMTTFYFKPNWLTDIIKEFLGANIPHHLADEIVLGCGVRLAKCIREGLTMCCKPDPHMIFKDKLRYELNCDEDTMSDISIVWKKAGFNVIPTKHYTNFRICEGIPRWSDYVQEVQEGKVPKDMYDVRPIEETNYFLWVHGIRFISNIIKKGEVNGRD